MSDIFKFFGPFSDEKMPSDARKEQLAKKKAAAKKGGTKGKKKGGANADNDVEAGPSVNGVNGSMILDFFSI